ncbi:MAG: ABC transporter ATP-binding protein [Acidobacteria bacterium]|nr:ABC transporter ATP-binding protein [Acidobacteriota bacterium]
MADIVISAERLGKRYRIRHNAERSEGFRHKVQTVATAPLRWLRSTKDAGREGTIGMPAVEDFWALRDVSFDVRRGEVMGIVGRNGAGKSTLLKLLSRITEPTEGRARIRGRVASLLEVGTGFHPELTGRENIFLNGTILGMSRREIQQRFDEIVAFAEIERFLDTPVKRYSSGMYLRLAFAVAAHLEPEILIVDEVLAVGDVAFQKKCMTRMGDVARGGRTILLVSHSLAAIESLCASCLVIDKGRLTYAGAAATAVQRYLAQETVMSGEEVVLAGHPGRIADSRPAMRSVTICNEAAEPSRAIRMGDRCSIAVRFAHDEAIAPVLSLVVRTSGGMAVFSVNSRIVSTGGPVAPRDRGVVTATFERLPLMPGSYLVDLFFGDAYADFDWIESAISFDVLEADVFGTGKIAPRDAGVVYCPATFSVTSDSADRVAALDMMASA